ncbi:hypothetical protein VL73_60 [Erwinia phage VL73]
MSTKIEAVTNAIVTIRTNAKATIKSVVAGLTELGINTDSLETKTKILFGDSLRALLDTLVEEEKAAAAADSLTELESLKVAIELTIQSASSSIFELGNLLIKAREACEDQKEFLDWTEANFNIKKAWAFKLMKVSQTFSGEPWNKVAPSVLYTLSSQATDEQMEEARKLAEVNKLDSKALKQLLAPTLPPVKPVVVDSGAVQQEASKSVQQALATTLINDIHVDGVESTGPIVQPVAPPAVSLTVDNTELQAKLSEALSTIQQLSARIEELTQPRLRTSSDMPMLPQFSSPCLYARLGLASEDAGDKAKILEAFRALCKAGYGRAHEAFQLIDEARHELIHAGEGVAA